jgi:hypothetical protein
VEVAEQVESLLQQMLTKLALLVVAVVGKFLKECFP